MALYENVRSKIVRQELDLVMAGPHFGLYSAKVKYLPENIEKDDFFNLCYGMLKKGDEIAIYTNKKDNYEVYYKFLVIGVDIDNKKVTTLLIKKVDLLNPEEAVEVEGVDPEILNAAIIKVVDAKVKALVADIQELNKAFETYTTETDDQLEEIETVLEGLAKANEDKTAATTSSTNAPAAAPAQQKAAPKQAEANK